ncbi:MAG TPA: flavodoxin [Candidatus Faecousia excrementipullorum]|nr:flavodoxin [Candidatus Faecousia excrementipullorum]
MAKLVVFYSRADENYFGGQYRVVEVGNTEKVAHMIAEATGADLFKIQQKVPYSPNYKRCIEQAMAHKRAKARPELVELPECLDSYDEIYLGYPNYWGDMPMAVYTFLDAFDWTGKTIYPFCTHEGSGLSGTGQNIARTCKGADVRAGLAICGSDAEHSKGLVLSWLNH